MSSAVSTPVVNRIASSLWLDKPEYIMFRIAKRVAELTEELTTKGRPPLKMSMGAPTLPPPNGVMKVLKDSLDESGIHVYSTTRGELFFREAVAQRVQKRFGLTLDAKTEICSLIGSKEGLAHIFRGIITPTMNEAEQDIILTPDPGYASYKGSIEGAGGKSVSIPLTPDNGYMPNLDEVWEQLKADGVRLDKVKALIVNYPSNPLGLIAPYRYYEHVIDFAKQHDLLVISDNAYADLYFDKTQRPHSILEVPGALDVAIELHSLSKPYCLTGWRMGFAMGAKPVIDLLATVKSSVDSGLFKGLQKAGAYALTSDEADEHIERVSKIYAKGQQVFVEGLKTLGWPVESMLIPKATFYLWMPIPKRFKTAVEFSNALLETSGIVTVPGTAFGEYGEGYIRLSLVLPEEQLNEVIQRMKDDGFTWSAA